MPLGLEFILFASVEETVYCVLYGEERWGDVFQLIILP